MVENMERVAGNNGAGRHVKVDGHAGSCEERDKPPKVSSKPRAANLFPERSDPESAKAARGRESGSASE